jgi:hypothetical protein
MAAAATWSTLHVHERPHSVIFNLRLQTLAQILSAADTAINKYQIY